MTLFTYINEKVYFCENICLKYTHFQSQLGTSAHMSQKVVCRHTSFWLKSDLICNIEFAFSQKDLCSSNIQRQSNFISLILYGEAAMCTFYQLFIE